jgi:DNA-binding CsgD family transcriptional regulator
LRAVERSVALEREHMFVSDIRTAVAQLLADDLTLNEIAHRLGVARATVGYHAQALREAEEGRPSRSRGKGTGPVAAPSVMRGQVRRLLDAGHSRAAVAQLLGVTRSTVTYHAARLGRDIDERCGRRYDWRAIRAHYEEGHSVAECRSRFGFNGRAWYEAIRRGLITPRPSRIPLEQLLVAGPRRNRSHLKKRLFDAGIKARRCESCGLSEWRGIGIPLALHHVNGDRHDNRLENLQVLCPNCHSQTDTWAGRNGGRPTAAVVKALDASERPAVGAQGPTSA